MQPESQSVPSNPIPSLASLETQFAALDKAIAEIYKGLLNFLKNTSKDGQQAKQNKPKEEKALSARFLLGHIYDKLALFDLLIDELYLQIDAVNQELLACISDHEGEQTASLHEFRATLDALALQKMQLHDEVSLLDEVGRKQDVGDVESMVVEGT
jgi:hypothetical protein